MIPLRALASGVTSAVAVFFVVHASGCGTDAVGVEECRDIENARCEAAQYCGLVEPDAVEQCQRFYRDQCLHGMASGERPGAPRVKECVRTIQLAGACAKAGGKTLADCVALGLEAPSTETTHTEVCKLVAAPEGAAECDFLYKPVEVPDAAADTAADGSSEASGDAAAD